VTLILDGLNVFIRAKSSAFKAKNKTKSTIENFLSIFPPLNKLLPKKIIIIWEHPDYGEKRRLVPTYKTNRNPIIDTQLIGEIKKLCFYLGITQYEWIGKEADECAAYLSYKYPYEKLFFYSADKDWLQLCDNNNHNVLLPSSLTTIKTNLGSYQLYNKARFVGEFKFSPYKYPLYKTIVGDCSDNVKSMGGIDKITIAELMLKYDSIEGVLTETFNPRIQEYINANKQLIVNSYHTMNLLRDYDGVRDEEFKITESKRDLQMLVGFFKLHKIADKFKIQ